MKKMMIMAAFACAALATPAMAQHRAKTNKDLRTEAGVTNNDKQQNQRMKDPKARTAKMADKLGFTDAQRARLASLNEKYPGTDFDRKAYREEFRTILTEAQKQQVAEWKAKHKEKNGRPGGLKKA